MVTALLFALTLLSGPGALQATLDQQVGTFSRAWVEKDSRALGRLLAKEGVRLHLPGEDLLMIRPRQAEAALESFLGRYTAGEARVARVSRASGGSEKAFAEVTWRTGSPGVSEPVIFTLFVALALDGGDWAVTEIRVLL